MRGTIATLLVTLVLGGSAAASDWHAGEVERCDKQVSTADIVECVVGISDEWDVRLNLAWHGITTNLTGERREAFRDAQRKWITYRDANCDWYRSREGSVAEVEWIVCMLGMTRERVVEMENWLAR